MDKKKKRGVRDSENTINIGLSVGQVCNLPTQGSWRPHSMQAQGKIWVFFSQNWARVQCWEPLRKDPE
jgi:hypothetical protein